MAAGWLDEVEDHRGMGEYLIRTQATHEWPAVHRNRMPVVLTPSGYDCAAVSGWGDFRLQCGAAQVTFSGEEAGWHVVVEGELADTQRFMAQVTSQVTQESGEACEWLPL